MGEGLGVRDKVIDQYVNLEVHEEGAEPFAEVGVEAKEGDEVQETLNIDVVKEPLDVKEEKGADHL
jgi:hypothetical protein